jgi:ribose 5-phosphate isomerase A
MTDAGTPGPSLLDDPARAAAVHAVLERIEPGMTIGLGSGRAVFALVEAIEARWGNPSGLRAAFASERTSALARAAGIEVVELDGKTTLDVAIDGADEIDPALDLIKGGGAALLREKLVVEAATRFLVVAEEGKRVDRLGAGFLLPVEVVTFAWADTRRRLLDLFPDATLRRTGDGAPVVTDEHNYLLDCVLPPADLPALAAKVKGTTGVVEHGLFLGLADEALLGKPDGTLLTLARP